jgi:toxin secretion/phage lysis holin
MPSPLANDPIIGSLLSNVSAIKFLAAMMLVDVVSGILAGFITKRLSSTVSMNGMARKVFIWILVGMAAILDPLSGDVPEVKLACIGFGISEGISILENAGRAGVPMPAVLKESLYKLKSVNPLMSGEGQPLIIERETKIISERPAPPTPAPVAAADEETTKSADGFPAVSE